MKNTINSGFSEDINSAVNHHNKSDLSSSYCSVRMHYPLKKVPTPDKTNHVQLVSYLHTSINMK